MTTTTAPNVVEPDKYRVSTGSIIWLVLKSIIWTGLLVTQVIMTIYLWTQPDITTKITFTLLDIIFVLMLPFLTKAEIKRLRSRPKERQAADQAELDWQLLLQAIAAQHDPAIDEVYPDNNLRVYIVDHDPAKRIICRREDNNIRVTISPAAATAFAAVLNQLDEANQTSLITETG